jgi:SulP family sulfate permease
MLKDLHAPFPADALEGEHPVGLRRFFPILTWGAGYSGRAFGSDFVAAATVTMLLLPQALAYALLVGVPPQAGLYASMAPLLLYAIFGTSTALSIGPIAVVSLMTGSAAAKVAPPGTPEHLGAVVAFTLITGILLVAMGALRLGFLVSFISHPVVSAFIIAAAVHIAATQASSLLGIPAKGKNLLGMMSSIVSNAARIHPWTAAVGLLSLSFLLWARRSLRPLLLRLRVGGHAADLLAKTGPAVVIVAATAAVWALELDERGIGILGTIPRGLPMPTLPPFDIGLWKTLLLPALLAGIVGYVESISVALTLAARRRERVDPDQELIAQGAADIAAAVSGGFPVAGAISRSAVNFDAGVQTPAAGAYTAAGIGLVVLFLTPLLFFLPKAALAAVIIAAVLSLPDLGALKRAHACSRADSAAMAATILVTWTMGIEQGLTAGVTLSIALHLFDTSRPHVAVVGQIPGTAHFRNVQNFAAVTDPEILSLRVDESLYFPNARFIEDLVNDAVAANPAVRHVIFECIAVNKVDASAIESLEAINRRLEAGGIRFHLSEVKRPVMDRLSRSGFLEKLTGSVYLSHYHAVLSIKPDLARDTRENRNAPPVIRKGKGPGERA